MISHISYAQERAKQTANHYSPESICSSIGNNGQVSQSEVRQMIASLKSEELQSFKYFKLMAKFNGMSLSEFLLHPDADFDGKYSTASDSALRHNVQMIRVSKGMSAAALGEQSGLGVSFIDDLERNTLKEPWLGSLQIIADTLEVEVASLFSPIEGYYNPRHTRFSHSVFVEKYVDELLESYKNIELYNKGNKKISQACLSFHRVNKKGRPLQSLALIEKLGRMTGKSVAEVFINPNCPVDDKYKSSSLAFLGLNIRRIRKVKKITQADLAIHAGYTSQTPVCLVEQGRNYPLLGYTQRMADYLGVEIADLFLPPPEVKPQRKVVT